MCAVVGFLSKRAINDAAQISSEPFELSCEKLIKSPLEKSSRVLLSDFVFTDRIATIDYEGDGKWEEVAIPLFPPNGLNSKASYSSVIVCFRDVPDLETLHQRLASNELQANYWVHDQSLHRGLLPQLAVKFENMDFRNSPVVTVGYKKENPLGETSLRYSYQIGAGAIGVAVLTLIYLASASLSQQVPKRPRRRTVANRTSEQSDETHRDLETSGEMLDLVRSIRDKQVQS